MPPIPRLPPAARLEPPSRSAPRALRGPAGQHEPETWVKTPVPLRPSTRSKPIFTRMIAANESPRIVAELPERHALRRPLRQRIIHGPLWPIPHPRSPGMQGSTFPRPPRWPRMMKKPKALIANGATPPSSSAASHFARQQEPPRVLVHPLRRVWAPIAWSERTAHTVTSQITGFRGH